MGPKMSPYDGKFWNLTSPDIYFFFGTVVFYLPSEDTKPTSRTECPKFNWHKDILTQRSTNTRNAWQKYPLTQILPNVTTENRTTCANKDAYVWLICHWVKNAKPRSFNRNPRIPIGLIHQRWSNRPWKSKRTCWTRSSLHTPVPRNIMTRM